MTPTMRAAVLRSGRFAEAEVPVPQPGRGQVLAEPIATGICGSDLSAARHTEDFLAASRDSGTEAFLFDPGADLVMGHELCARVLSPGKWEGRTVVGLPWAVDAGGTLRTVGYSTAFPGGFGERVVLQEAALVPVPDHVPAHVAALTEPLAVGFGNVARAAPPAGSGAVVIGAGPIGLGAMAALVERGVAPVIVSEPSPRRRALAERFGAHVVVDPGVRDPFDAWREASEPGQELTVLECSGKPGMFNTVLHRAPRSTKVLLIGACMTEDVFRPVVGIYKDITVTMCMAYPPEEFARTLGRIADGTVDAAALVTGEVGLAGVNAALDTLRAPDDHVKVLVRPDVPGIGVHPPR
ncbi:zinc-binding dehydrogenase [Streptomyces sp. NPDC046821]|uniref:zinc-binding dehydrogenase n=1 Tax=Streptomyces sp. NPDC046821 TaxID=3154702 RepID=UPI0033E3A1C2